MGKPSNSIEYLRTVISDQYLSKNIEDHLQRAEEIKISSNWISASEGELLAKALLIPIRTVTVSKDRWGIRHQ